MDYLLTDVQLHQLQNHPLVVTRYLTTDLTATVTTYPQCGGLSQYNAFHRMLTGAMPSMVTIMLEQSYYTRPHNYYTFILEKGEVEVAVVDLLVTSLGRPAFGKTVNILPSPYIVPADGISYNHEASVDQFGYARFVFRANSIKTPRQGLDLDGQVYRYMYHVKGERRFCANDTKHPVRTSDGEVTCIEMITIKVYSDMSYNSPFNWVEHVQPIFLQYARLYPIMKNIVNLSDYQDVIQPYIRHLLNFSLQLDWNHPNYMPISRDLSNTKRKKILEWLTKPCYNSTHCLLHLNGVVRYHNIKDLSLIHI